MNLLNIFPILKMKFAVKCLMSELWFEFNGGWDRSRDDTWYGLDMILMYLSYMCNLKNHPRLQFSFLLSLTY